jgi:acetyl-CoA C-acetyltransferase
VAEEILLAGAARTPIGSFNGVFADVPATVLGSAVLRAALERAGVRAEDVDEVIFGNVLSAGLGQNPARQAALGAGIPATVGATNVNKVCGSGLKAVMLATQAIRCGDASVVAAGGMESMSRAPHLLPGARKGYRFGNGEIVDSLLRDGLVDAYDNLSMGVYGDRCAARYAFTREQQDDYAVASYRRALEAAGAGRFDAELCAVDVPRGAGHEPVTADEQPHRFNEEKLRRLRPAFGADGTVTAGNASSLNDAAAALVVLSESAAQRLGVPVLGRVLGAVTVSREPEWFTLAPIDAIARLLAKLSLAVGDVDLFEINEAFAAVALAAMADLRIPHERLNVHGGAIALGHPIGASGARTLVTLLHALRQRNARIGVVALCIGGGEAVALAVERLDP